MSASATARLVLSLALLLLCPLQSLGCHSTTIIKQLGSPFGLHEDDKVSNFVSVNLPEECETGGTGGTNGTTSAPTSTPAVSTPGPDIGEGGLVRPDPNAEGVQTGEFFEEAPCPIPNPSQVRAEKW